MATMRPRSSQDRVDADDAAVDELLRKPAGLSTLDFLKKRTPQTGNPNDANSAPSDVRREMGLLAGAELRKQQRLKNAQRNAGLDFNRLGLRADEKEEQKLIQRLLKTPDAPEQRKLIGGRLMRPSELADLRDSHPSSLSPVLNTTQSAPALHGRENPSTSETDKLLKPQIKIRDPSVVLLDDGRVSLRKQEDLLQQELLKVTKKICRKYSKRLAPVTPRAMRSRTHDLAEQWTQAQSQGKGNDSDRIRNAAFVAGQFSTQTSLDFYARELEPREPESNRHRHNEAPTKYGDALARNRASLRGVF